MGQVEDKQHFGVPFLHVFSLPFVDFGTTLTRTSQSCRAQTVEQSNFVMIHVSLLTLCL